MLTRSAPLLRFTPLRPSTKPLMRSPIRRVSARARAHARARSRAWAAVCRAVFAACGNRCQVNGPGCTGRAEHGHHKLPRSQGGRDVASNALAVCHRCHLRVHLYPSESYALGYLLRKERPAC
jgi:5-methylcytosine-specific restriction endonuclease McrA